MMPAATDPITDRLTALKAALSDPGTWSLNPLADECQALIEMRQAELGARPATKPASRRRHDTDEPIFLEPGELWP